MTTEDRIWVLALAIVCAASVAGFARDGSPLSAGIGTLSGLLFLARLVDGGRKR